MPLSLLLITSSVTCSIDRSLAGVLLVKNHYHNYSACISSTNLLGRIQRQQVLACWQAWTEGNHDPRSNETMNSSQTVSGRQMKELLVETISLLHKGKYNDNYKNVWIVSCIRENIQGLYWSFSWHLPTPQTAIPVLYIQTCKVSDLMVVSLLAYDIIIIYLLKIVLLLLQSSTD